MEWLTKDNKLVKEFLFNDETSNDLRKIILKYKHEFFAVLDIVNQ